MNTTADFLSKAAKDYIDALAAIEKFEEEACGVCRNVYEKYRSQLVSKIGLKDEHCTNHDDNKDPANGHAELGVWQSTQSGREWLYVYIMWEGTKDGAPEISACVSLEFSKKSERNDYAKLLHKIPSIQTGDDGSYYLWSRKELTDLCSCAETFYKLLDEWLACWPSGRRLK